MALCFIIMNVVADAQQSTLNVEITKTIKVLGACGMCQDRIETAAKINGVRSAHWDVETKMLTIVFDSTKITVDKIENSILAVGHDVENKKAKDKIYNALSECCHYRDAANTEATDDRHLLINALSNLNEVAVLGKQSSSFIPYKNTIRSQVMTGKELLKAACCNLSESFETNPSVDVSFNDAITGSKQIQLLGLSGNYTQLTIENLPGPRGLATPLGLNTIAGPWIESIQLTKGAGSVVNGFESIAGQINVELKQPETAEQLLGNIYVNDYGKTDFNLNLVQKLSTKWSTILLLHDNFLNNKSLDHNKDGFRDLPTGNQFSAINKYKFDNQKGWVGQWGIKMLKDNRVGGQTSFEPQVDNTMNTKYGVGINTERYVLFGKIGFVFPEKKYKSIGLQVATIQHQQSSYFGRTHYDAIQKSFYSNLIYQSIIGSTMHQFKTGFSFQYDIYDEKWSINNYYRKEVVPGTFFEYTYTPNDKLSMVAGWRADNNSIFGGFLTPRLNIRYEPVNGTVIRFSAGRGQRTANIFAENNSVLVSARNIVLAGDSHVGGYGLTPEIAWNKGISIDQKFNIFNRKATLSFDYFRNDFENQVVVNLENVRQVVFSNLEGKSYSNSFQTELNMEPVKNVDIRMAYRFFDVKQTYSGVLMNRPFIAKNRAFLSVDYTSLNEWKFNYTITYNGAKRIPNTSLNPSVFQMPEQSPAYFMMNAQVSKTIGKKNAMDFYLGAENIADFIQESSIISANLPFSPYFDASLIWGPTSGRMIYAGWRIKIK